MAQPLRKKNAQNDPNLNGTITQIIYNTGGATPIMNSSFVVLSTDTNLTNERVLTAGPNIALTDNGPNSSIVVDVTDTAVTPGTYTASTITVDQKGRITAASSGSGPATQTTLFNETGTDANFVFIGSKLATDSARRFSTTVSGDLAWGDGTAAKARLNYAGGSALQIVDALGNAADLNLSTLRGNAAILSAPNSFNVSFETRTTGDVNPRFQVTGDGKIGLGGGATGMDLYAYRSGNAEMSLGSSPTTADGTLKISTIKTASGNLIINPAGPAVDFSGKQLTNAIFLNMNGISGGDGIFSTNMAGDTWWRMYATAKGTLRFGNGSQASPGTYATLECSATGGELILSNADPVNGMGTLVLKNVKTTGTENLVLNPGGPAVDFSGKQIINAILPSSGLSFPISYTASTGTNKFLTVNQTGDTAERWSVDANGMQVFGMGTADTFLRRTGAGRLAVGTSSGNTDGAVEARTMRCWTLDPSAYGSYVNVAGGSNFSTLDGLMRVTKTTGDAFVVNAPSDAFFRFLINNAGQLGWSAGTTAPDAFLYRNGSGSLILSNTTAGAANGTFNAGTITLQTIGSTSLTSALNGVLQVRNASGTAQSGRINCGTVYGEGGGSLQLNSDFGFILCNNNRLGEMKCIDICGTLTNNIDDTANRSIVAGSGNTLGANANNSAVLASTTTSISSTGGNNSIISSNTPSSISSGNNSSILASNGGSIAASSGCNIIMGSGNGNTTISGTAGGTFLWGSYVSTSFANVFGLSDSTATPISCGSGKTFYTRFTGGHYFTSNAGASVGVQLPGGGSAWVAISDARLKDIHGEIEGSVVLDSLDKMRVVRFNYKCDAEDHENEEREGREERCAPRIGMVAQEVNALYEGLGLRKNYSLAHPYNAEHPDEEPVGAVCGDEIAYLALVCAKELKKESKELREGLRKTIEVVKGLSTRLKSAESKLALASTKVGTFEKL